MTIFHTGRAFRTAMRTTGLALAIAAIGLSAPLLGASSRAEAAGTSDLYAATVSDQWGVTLAQLRPGDIVVGTVNVEMLPRPRGVIFWGATLWAPGWSLGFGPDGGQRQFTFTATGYGPLQISITGGTAYTLFTVTHGVAPVLQRTSSVGAVSVR